MQCTDLFYKLSDYHNFFVLKMIFKNLADIELKPVSEL